MGAMPADDDFSYEIETEDPPVSGDDAALDIEVTDDTPEDDRGRDPMPQELVAELEADPLEEYSEKVKLRLKQMRKVWHDERREKEREVREKAEAVIAAQRLLEENRKLKATINEGEQTLVGSFKQNAEFELDMARREYREAYESGDTDKILEAQEKLGLVQYKLQQLAGYRPTLQEVDNEVTIPQQQVQVPRPDAKTMAWQERNTWWGSDPEMTASALGLHQKLERERGPQFVGSDEYWSVIDKTMRRRFPEYFGGESSTTEGASKSARQSKPVNVVAPASRSTSPKQVKLTASAANVAKRLGLTNEQYYREVLKLER